MTKSLLFAGAWIATLAVVFFIGRSMSPDENLDRRDPQPVPVPARGMESPVEYRSGAPAEPASLAPPSDRDPAPEFRPQMPDVPVPVEPLPRDEPPPSSAAASPQGEFTELSAAFRTYVAKQFGRGQDGAMDIVKEMDRLLVQLKEADIDERQAVREFYPWLKFLVEHESETVDFLQNLFTLMAENPTAFEGIDKDALEIFLEPFPMVLPGVISEDRLAEFRALANRIIAMPKDQLPESIQRNLREIERALTFAWAAPIDSEGVVKAIRSGALQPGQALLAMKETDLASLDQADRTEVLRVAMAANAYQVIRTLRKLGPGSVNEAILDQAFIESMASGQATTSYVDAYAKAMGRKTWMEVRPLVDSALAQQPGSADRIVWSLTRLRGDLRPDETWVRDFMARYELTDQSKRTLERTFKLR